jgi:hypothetical protein
MTVANSDRRPCALAQLAAAKSFAPETTPPGALTKSVRSDASGVV